AKVEQEKLCKEYKDQLDITIARPSVISGEREAELYEFIKAVKGGVVPLVGFNEKYLGIINIKDLIKALHDMTVSEKTSGKAYYLSSEETISWKALAEMIAKKLNKKPLYLKLPHFVIKIAGSLSGFVGKLQGKAPTFDSEKAKEGVQTAWVCSVEKAKQDFGFEQTVSIEQGISEAIDWYKMNGWL
ncbi:MAG: NAD-dependent epimerase/dehydratase family protein, partial [Chitinophagales bacterium]